MLDAFEALVGDNPHGLVRMRIVEGYAPYTAGDLAGFPPDEALRLFTRTAAVPVDADGNEITVVAGVPVGDANPAGDEAHPIPDDWAGLHWAKRLKLARDLTGNQDLTNAEQADDAIRSELQRRATAAAGAANPAGDRNPDTTT